MITMAAVFCGFNAIRICAKPGAEIEDFHRAAVLLMFAMLFDLLDGRVALLGVLLWATDPFLIAHSHLLALIPISAPTKPS